MENQPAEQPNTEPELPVQAEQPPQKESTNVPHVMEIADGKVDPTFSTRRRFQIALAAGGLFSVVGLILRFTSDNGFSGTLLLLGLATLMFGGIAYFTLKLMGRV